MCPLRGRGPRSGHGHVRVRRASARLEPGEQLGQALVGVVHARAPCRRRPSRPGPRPPGSSTPCAPASGRRARRRSGSPSTRGPGAPSYSKVCTMPSGDGVPWKTPWKPCSGPSASVWTNRHRPPSRVSYRTTVMVRSRGPSHCTSSSGSVCARNTRSRARRTHGHDDLRNAGLGGDLGLGHRRFPPSGPLTICGRRRLPVPCSAASSSSSRSWLSSQNCW